MLFLAAGFGGSAGTSRISGSQRREGRSWVAVSSLSLSVSV